MKNLAKFLLGALLCVGVSSCEDNSQLTSSGDPSYGAKPGSGTPADPAIVFQGFNTSKGRSRNALFVCDANGANPTVMVVAPSQIHKYWGQPTWSGDASAISYIEADTGRSECNLKTTQISVVAGKATAGTTATLLTVSRANDSKVMAGGIWSPTANEIAYSLQETGGTYLTRNSEIRVIPSGGGASELIYSSPDGTSIYHMAWNADGSKIVVVEWKITSDSPLAWEYWIKVIDRATGNVEQTISADDLGLTNCTSITCSRAGLNSLAITNNADVSVYTIDLNNPTAATLVQSSALYPSWSPNNEQLLYRDYSGGMVTETLSSGARTTILQTNVSVPYWKK